jgi:ParB family chromosome partitioning protein
LVKKRSGLGSNPFNASGMGIFAPTEASVNDAEGDPLSVALTKIVLPKQQPRRYFDPDKMSQLVQSIEEHGILEPLLVRPVKSGKYELVAGERRFRAAQEAGLTEVPVVIRQFNDEEALQVALIENLQREDLNPVEETEGILSLLSINLSLPPSEVSQLLHRLAKSSDSVVGKKEKAQLETIEDVFRVMGSMAWESFATHRLPLLNLPEPILEALRSGKLEYTKARAIAKLKDASQQQALLEQVIQDGLPLSQIQAEVSAANRQSQTDKPPSLKSEFDGAYSRLKRSSVWSDRTKQKRLKKLLTEIEVLLKEE